MKSGDFDPRDPTIAVAVTAAMRVDVAVESGVARV